MTIAANPESFVPVSKEGMEVKIGEFKVKPAMTKESIRTWIWNKGPAQLASSLPI